MPVDPILRGWLALAALTMGTGAVALSIDAGISASWAGALILGLAIQKARVILNVYLGLDAAPFWRRGFDGALIAFGLLLFGLYLAPVVLPAAL